MIYSGWWYTYFSEKYKFVSWDDDIPNWMEQLKKFQTTNQYWYMCPICELFEIVQEMGPPISSTDASSYLPENSHPPMFRRLQI